MHHSPGSQPNLSKLVDNQQVAAGLARLQQSHYLPQHYRAISPTQAAAALADDLYHQHALHSAASHPYLNHHAAAAPTARDILHLSQHNLTSHHHPSLQAQYNSSKQRLLQSQSSQQSDSPQTGQPMTVAQQQTAALLHHPDCAAVIRPATVAGPNAHHPFYSTHGSPIRQTPPHKQVGGQCLSKQLLDDSADEIALQQAPYGSRPPTSTMHNQPPLFGMSRPSNLINSSQDEECESDLASLTNQQQQQLNGQLSRDLEEYSEENDAEDKEEELIEDEQPVQLQQQAQQLQQQQQQLQQQQHQLQQQINASQLLRNRPQFRQLSSNSNNSNDSNESAVDQPVPLTNRLQHLNYGPKEANSLVGQQVGGQPTGNSTPSQQITQRNYVDMNSRQNSRGQSSTPDVVVMR